MKPEGQYHGPVVFLTREVEFSAAHRLAHPAWSEARNREVFGPCSHPPGHGHNYRLQVTVKGGVDPETGMVLDLKQLKRIVHEEFRDKCDHRDFNRDVEFMHGILPTAENIVMRAWELIEPHLAPGSLYHLRLYETDRNFVDYYGPAGGEPPAAPGTRDRRRE
jgi:6-pyruvoyltetrahydropterin/6-carboxytetrahydropterin synthase